MNQTKIILHASPFCMTVGKGPVQGAMRVGAHGISMMNIFDSHYTTATDFCERLYNLVHHNLEKDYPVKEIILNVAFNFWKLMKPEQSTVSNCSFKRDKPKEFWEALKYSNRFYPDDEQAYLAELSAFIDELLKRDLLKLVTWDLGHEPNAARYWWEDPWAFKEFMDLKLPLLRDTGRPIIGIHTSTSLLNGMSSNQSKWETMINEMPTDIGFSTSFYENTQVPFNYINNKFPTRTFNRIVLSECNYAAGMPEGSEKYNYVQSPMFMHYLVRLLTYSKVVNADTICLFQLYGCSVHPDKGEFALFKPTANGLSARPAWFTFCDFMGVIKDGWDVVPDGIQGANKRITLKTTGYQIV